MGNKCSSTGACSSQSKTKYKAVNRNENPEIRRNSQNVDHFTSLQGYTSQKTWIYKQNFVSTEKFHSAIKEYLRDQTFTSEVWNKVNVEEIDIGQKNHRSQSQAIIPRIKTLIREGIPVDKMKNVILEMFKRTRSYNDLEYDCAIKVAFPGKIPQAFKNVPLFSFSSKLEEVLPEHYLNPQGIEAFKRIMWVYEKNVPRLEYSPLLSQTVAILLIFLKEEEAFCIAKDMLDRSERMINNQGRKDEKRSLKWHFTRNKSHFEGSLESLTSFMADRSSGFQKLWKHLKKICCDCNDLFWRLIKTLLLGFLPLSVCLKIFVAFLNEGIKVYYRFMLALLRVFEEDLMQCTTPEAVLALMKEKPMSLNKAGLQNLASVAFGLNLSLLKNKFPLRHSQSFCVPDSVKLYFPDMSESSIVANTTSFESIWEWLPKELRIYKPVIAYTSKTHGWSLNTLYTKCAEKSDYKGVLLLIKTVDSVSFGAFIDGIVKLNAGTSVSIGSNDCFVFKLEPEEKKFGATSTKKKLIHLTCEKESLSIGSGSEGSAIYLSNDLQYGYSYKSETYNNEPLHSTKANCKPQFECGLVELYWIE